jgi:hypothetical protein
MNAGRADFGRRVLTSLAVSAAAARFANYILGPLRLVAHSWDCS